MRFPGRRRDVSPVTALREVNLVLAAGEVFGFLGPNGAGKTTTMEVLLGFVRPTSGQARVLGCDAWTAMARRRVGYLSEHPRLYPFLTGRELLALAGGLFGMRRRATRERSAELLARLRMEEAADRRIGTYSRGMLQRIGLAQALLNDPELLILDEPTGGLDPLGRMEMREWIAALRREGKTVFFSSHELSEVEMVCDRIAILVAGRIAAAGPPGGLKREGESLEQCFLRVARSAAPAEQP